jgi:hypothetical protein
MRDGFLTVWSKSCAVAQKRRPETKNRPISGGFAKIREMKKTF